MLKKNGCPSLLFLFCLMGCATATTAQSALLQHVKGRAVTTLNGRWNYLIDPYENGYYNYRHEPFDQIGDKTGGFFDDRAQKDKGELIEYNFDYSPTLNVPADWNSQVEKLSMYEGTVWYRRKFVASPKAGKKYVLYFGAANYEAHVYLNGKKLGMHKGGFTPFQFEVTGRLKEGDNSLVVKVDNTRHADEIPTVNTDWWNYGGLTRDVLLAELPPTYIADYKVQLAKNNPNRLEGYVQLSGANGPQTISISIPEAGVRTNLQANDSGKAIISLPVKKLSYWSPEAPKLYNVQLSTAADTVADKIGFRTITTRGQDILLNGKSVFLRGICLHEENPLIPGRLRNAGDMRMVLTWAKELGCNYVRLAHYPHSEEMMRLADEMGLLIWAEVPVYWTIAWQNAATYANAQQQLTELIVRDKNRASVIIWSVGNETPLSAPRYTFMTNLAAQARLLDSTRLVAAALEAHRNGNSIIVDDSLGRALDLVSFNQYAGWYWGSPKDILDKSFSIGYNKPVIVSEFGGDALGGFHADADTRWSEEYQEALYKSNLLLLNKIPGLRGMTPWILCDFRSPRRQHPIYQNYWNRKGLISELGVKKKAFWVVQQYYQQQEANYK